MRTVPPLGESSPASKPSSVDFPEPDAPTIATASPAMMSKDTSSRMCSLAPLSDTTVRLRVAYLHHRRQRSPRRMSRSGSVQHGHVEYRRREVHIDADYRPAELKTRKPKREGSLAAAPGNSGSARSIHVVVRRFLGDLHNVRTWDSRMPAEVISTNSARVRISSMVAQTHVAHGGTQAAHQLVDHCGHHAPFVGHAAFDAFRHQLVHVAVVVLEVSGRRRPAVLRPANPYRGRTLQERPWNSTVSPGASSVPANRPPSITRLAPAAMALEMSPE